MHDIGALCEKERKRVKEALISLEVVDGRAHEVMELVSSYTIDAEHFFSKDKFLEAFELYVYIFGILDTLAILGMVDPGDARKHFKVEQ